MRTTVTLAFILCLITVTSCVPPRQGISGVSGSRADELNTDRQPFDAVQDPPLSAETRFRAAKLAESQEAYSSAITQYNEALRLNPKHRSALYNLGLLHARLKQYPQAIDVWKRYVTLTNGSAVAYSNLGFCLELTGNTQEAEVAYREGIRKNPLSELCHINYGLMLVRINRLEEGRAQLQTVLTPAQVFYNIASVHEHLGRIEEARAEYLKALSLQPGFRAAERRLKNLRGVTPPVPVGPGPLPMIPPPRSSLGVPPDLSGLPRATIQSRIGTVSYLVE